MARRRAIEADELFETANRLQAEGKDVSATALLDALGGGSLRTIYKLLEVWQQQRPAVVITTPEEIPASVQAVFASCWRQATQEAGRQVIAVKEKAAEEVDAAVKKFQDALDAIENLEKESEADAQQIDTLKERVAELEAVLQKSQTEAAASKAAGEQLQQQVKAQEAELERLHSDIDKERSSRQQQLEKVEAASKTDREERDAAIKQASELRGQVEALKAQNTELLAKFGRDDKQPRKN